MTIFGIAGAIGTGKSFIQLFLALEYANEREKQLVTNFPLNITALHEYCTLPKYYDSPIYRFLRHTLGIFPAKSKNEPRYKWILNLIKNGGISTIPAPRNIQALMIPDSVVCLDEAGILLNSRNFKDTPKELLADLAQSRKDGIDLFWAAQFDEQVDYQFRLLTQYWIHADGLSIYDKKSKRPKLIYKKYYWFRAFEYFEWLHNKRDRTSHFKTRFAYSSRYIGGFLSPSDKLLFNCFDSFNRLDESKNLPKIHTLHNSRLPKNYYRDILGSLYNPNLDPLHSTFNPLLNPPFPPPPHPPTPLVEEVLLPLNKSFLLKQAILLSRQLRIKSPYFKDMTESQIQSWIIKNKKII